MKRNLFILICFFVLNISYASFPIDTNKVDSIIISESTEQFHKRLESQGFDITNCMCKDCRKFKGLLSLNSETNLTPVQKTRVNTMFLISALIIGFISLSIYVDFSAFPPITIPIILTVAIILYVNILIKRMREENQLKNKI